MVTGPLVVEFITFKVSLKVGCLPFVQIIVEESWRFKKMVMVMVIKSIQCRLGAWTIASTAIR